MLNHASYDSLVQVYVEDGLVDYTALSSDREMLDRYLGRLKRVDPNEYASWDSDTQKAFWINAYNAITLEGILRNYPIEDGFLRGIRFPKNSIRQIRRFWKTVFVPVMGQQITLDDIEHDILRKEFPDPRIHFVLVCASMGCPILESRAYLPIHLEDRLERATRRFIQDPQRVRLDREKNVLYLSSIFKWYAQDFSLPQASVTGEEIQETEDRDIFDFVEKYLSDEDRRVLNPSAWRIDYIKYDWSLNEKQ